MKRPPIFLTLQRVTQIHEEQLSKFGGRAGVRDITLVESAIGMPRQSFGGEFVHGDLAGMAAAYFFHLSMNQPFTDGNKRTGAAAAAVFLEINGIDFDVDPGEYAELGIALGAGKLAKVDVTAFFRRHVQASE